MKARTTPRALRLALLAITLLAVLPMLSACGKKGDPIRPGEQAAEEKSSSQEARGQKIMGGDAARSQNAGRDAATMDARGGNATSRGAAGETADAARGPSF